MGDPISSWQVQSKGTSLDCFQGENCYLIKNFFDKVFEHILHYPTRMKDANAVLRSQNL